MVVVGAAVVVVVGAAVVVVVGAAVVVVVVGVYVVTISTPSGRRRRQYRSVCGVVELKVPVNPSRCNISRHYLPPYDTVGR